MVIIPTRYRIFRFCVVIFCHPYSFYPILFSTFVSELGTWEVFVIFIIFWKLSDIEFVCLILFLCCYLYLCLGFLLCRMLSKYSRKMGDFVSSLLLVTGQLTINSFLFFYFMWLTDKLFIIFELAATNAYVIFYNLICILVPIRIGDCTFHFVQDFDFDFNFACVVGSNVTRTWCTEDWLV